ncbi:MAG: zinc transporter ZupT [Elusimicrobia bacterium]|nr:zinc transporter ZupT [Elusimicrobiota bacterium]
MTDVQIAFLLTLLAGLSTGIGSAIALVFKRTNTRLLAGSLGFSAGVMIYISLTVLLPGAVERATPSLGAAAGWYAALAFFAGIGLTGLIDALVPEFENPHEARPLEAMQESAPRPANGKLLRMGLFSAAAITLHNVPEGLATFLTALNHPVAGVSIAVAIAIHNIPEGISVSVPIYHSTGSRKKAFFYSFLTGLAEPAGALIGYLLLAPFLNDTLMGLVTAPVAGIMVYISFDELLPAAHEYGEHHIVIYSLVAGMAVMAGSLLALS